MSEPNPSNIIGVEIYLSDLVLLLKFNDGQKVCVTPIVGCVYSDLQKY